MRSLEPVNLLTNYWWASEPAGRGQAMDALPARGSDPARPARPPAGGVEDVFDHYVFGDPDAAIAHLPPGAHGMLGEPARRTPSAIRRALGQKLSR
ncbi:hypothetical protein ACRAWD_26410 [Caulobacter segnis]